MACVGYIDSDSSVSNSDDDFGNKYRLDISESDYSDCRPAIINTRQQHYSDFGAFETESDSDSESLSAARQWWELIRIHQNLFPQNLYFKETQD
ncbi:hypothetical protein TNCV_4045691 [Trichonephila clavipes]|nr:hypothetical protein TNCV_4045691 [Trichonephila clavipes]